MLGTRISVSAIRFPPSPICSYVTEISETDAGTGYSWVRLPPPQIYYFTVVSSMLVSYLFAASQLNFAKNVLAQLIKRRC